MTDRTVRLPDGRLLGYAEQGDPGGVPVVCCHGVPGGSSVYFAPEAVRTGGARLLAVARAGFGVSDPAPGHTLLDAVGDVFAFADSLGLDRFAVLGLSAGAPTALGCGFVDPDRVAVVGLACGVGPVFDQPRFDELLPPEWQVLLPIARVDKPGTMDLLRAVALPAVEACTTDVEGQFEEMLATAPPADRAEMAASRAWVIDNLRSTYLQGPDTFVHEIIASVGPWAFEPSDVQAPVHMWHGDSDELAPIEVARWISEQVPQSTLTVYPGEGHFLSATHHGDWLAALTDWT